MNQSVIDNAIEVTLKQADDFLKVRETLTRIGIRSRKEKKLYQSCHILHKQGHYYIVHFKELFALDGRSTNFSDEDVARRNRIVRLLAEWDLVTPVDPERFAQPLAPVSEIKIIPHKEKHEWVLVAKYNIGRKRASESEDCSQ
jgi:translational regulator